MIHHDIVPESREEAGAPVSENDNKEGVASENTTTDEKKEYLEMKQRILEMEQHIIGIEQRVIFLTPYAAYDDWRYQRLNVALDELAGLKAQIEGERLTLWELAGQLSESEDKDDDDDEAAPTETV
jgi:hypothetical protein